MALARGSVLNALLASVRPGSGDSSEKKSSGSDHGGSGSSTAFCETKLPQARLGYQGRLECQGRRLDSASPSSLSSAPPMEPLLFRPRCLCGLLFTFQTGCLCNFCSSVGPGVAAWLFLLLFFCMLCFGFETCFLYSSPTGCIGLLRPFWFLICVNCVCTEGGWSRTHPWSRRSNGCTLRNSRRCFLGEPSRRPTLVSGRGIEPFETGSPCQRLGL